MRIFITLIALLFATKTFAGEKFRFPPNEELRQRTVELARERNIPLIQVAYRTPDRFYAFESSQREEIVADTNTQTIFQAASISKVVFSYIVMRLIDRGEIDLDKPLHKYMKGVDERFCNAFDSRAENRENMRRAKQLTARIVLNHRSGLPNWSRLPKRDGFKPLAFKCNPGEKYTYSGEAIWYLQRVVEKITGKSLEELAREEVFEPFGMENSSYIWLPRYNKMAAYGYNKNHEKRGQGQRQKAGNAAYSLRTNVADFSRFLDGLMEGRGLTPATFEMMMTSLKPAPKEEVCFGLGIRVTPNRNSPGDKVWHHSGSNPNFRCRFMVLPERKSYLVYFTNSVYGAGKTHHEMRKIYYPDYRGASF